MTDEFSRQALYDHLGSGGLTASVVTLRIEKSLGEAQGMAVEAHLLDLDEALAERFRTGLRRTVGAMRHHEMEPWVDGWVSIDDQLAELDAAELHGPVMDAVTSALAEPSRSPDFNPQAARAELDAEADAEDAAQQADGAETKIVGAYAVAVEKAGSSPVLFFRRRDPVERLSQSRFAAFLSGTRLTTPQDVFTFDSSFDVVAWGERSVIRNSSSYEDIFMTDRERRDGATAATAILTSRVTVENEDVLGDTIREDLRFAGRLRSIGRRGRLHRLDPASVRLAAERFKIDHLFFRGGALVFVPRLRFVWLAALDDSLLESPGTRELSVVRIRKEWKRWLVTGVERDARGGVLALVGECGRVRAEDAIRRMRRSGETFYVELPDGRADLDVDEDASPPCLVARSGADATDRLQDVPTVPGSGADDAQRRAGEEDQVAEP